LQIEIPPSVTHHDIQCTRKPFTGHKWRDIFKLIYKEGKNAFKILTKKHQTHT